MMMSISSSHQPGVYSSPPPNVLVPEDVLAVLDARPPPGEDADAERQAASMMTNEFMAAVSMTSASRPACFMSL